MVLPNPSMSFSPFAILTAEELNDIVENVQAVADEIGGAWQSWTPTLTNVTLGTGGTVTGRYVRIGKSVRFRLAIKLGTGGSIGSGPTATLPATSAALLGGSNMINGSTGIYDATATGDGFVGNIYQTSTTVMQPQVQSVNAINIPLTAIYPITFAVNDVIMMAGEYESA